MDICKYKEVKFNHDTPVTKKCLKTLIQGIFALVCDVMAGWPLPPTHSKVVHAVAATLYN